MKPFILWSTRLLVLSCTLFLIGTVAEINAALKPTLSPKVAGSSMSFVDTKAIPITVPKDTSRVGAGIDVNVAEELSTIAPATNPK